MATVGLEGFERRGRWLVCVLTGCAIDATRFDQDVCAVLRQQVGAGWDGASVEQIGRAEQATELYYRELLAAVIEQADGECACGADLFRTTVPAGYMCPVCRIVIPGDVFGERRAEWSCV
ncbi:MAG: hypothetical protein JOZ41_16275 [Chloroflexi bacterium]|nr:hypothetical protein [Chloroflexota bacterium]